MLAPAATCKGKLIRTLHPSLTSMTLTFSSRVSAATFAAFTKGLAPMPQLKSLELQYVGPGRPRKGTLLNAFGGLDKFVGLTSLK